MARKESTSPRSHIAPASYYKYVGLARQSRNLIGVRSDFLVSLLSVVAVYLAVHSALIKSTRQHGRANAIPDEHSHFQLFEPMLPRGNSVAKSVECFFQGFGGISDEIDCESMSAGMDAAHQLCPKICRHDFSRLN